MVLLIDKKYVTDLAKNPVVHGRSANNRSKVSLYHRASKVVHLPTEIQLANVFTKVVKIDKFVKLRSMIGVVTLENLN